MNDRRLMRFLFCGLALALVLVVGCGAGDRSFDPRPRVLIIGDSISLGYTPFVADMLKDRALVIHSPGNAQHTWNGVVWLDKWLGHAHWDVIHFNWGLWDMCYRRSGRGGSSLPDKDAGVVTISLAEYRENLDNLVARLEKTGAVLIWASTTAVPEGDPGRYPDDVERYNSVAAQVMAEHGISINDLYALSRDFPPELRTAPDNVHFTRAGYQKLAISVAQVLGEVLPAGMARGD